MTTVHPATRAFDISVEHAYSDDTNEISAFLLGSRRVEVHEMLDRWRGADYVYLKLRGEDNIIYILRHQEESDCWAMTMFQVSALPTVASGPRHPPPPLQC